MSIPSAGSSSSDSLFLNQIIHDNDDCTRCSLFKYLDDDHSMCLTNEHLKNSASQPSFSSSMIENKSSPGVVVLCFQLLMVQLRNYLILKKITSITHLHLENNEISFIEDGIRKLPNNCPLLSLQYLNLSHNKLKSLNLFNLIRLFPNLEFIMMRNNLISQLNSHSIPIYGNIKVLDLSENKIKKLDGLSSLKYSLQVLNIQKNEIETLNDMSQVLELEQLTNIDFRGNPIQSLEEENLIFEEILEKCNNVWFINGATTLACPIMDREERDLQEMIWTRSGFHPSRNGSLSEACHPLDYHHDHHNQNDHQNHQNQNDHHTHDHQNHENGRFRMVNNHQVPLRYTSSTLRTVHSSPHDHSHLHSSLHHHEPLGLHKHPPHKHPHNNKNSLTHINTTMNNTPMNNTPMNNTPTTTNTTTNTTTSNEEKKRIAAEELLNRQHSYIAEQLNGQSPPFHNMRMNRSRASSITPLLNDSVIVKNLSNFAKVRSKRSDSCPSIPSPQKEVSKKEENPLNRTTHVLSAESNNKENDQQVLSPQTLPPQQKTPPSAPSILLTHSLFEKLHSENRSLKETCLDLSHQITTTTTTTTSSTTATQEYDDGRDRLVSEQKEVILTQNKNHNSYPENHEISEKDILSCHEILKQNPNNRSISIKERAKQNMLKRLNM
ncbi:hypothetical protein FDP41_003503 [Naegleria fowleri]|uniref:Uncharacterized protein n=1 Tax=Naegleria fowleri TaxID=5763 RepID=A0A6A5BT31_NAEFO|nr:uncharacterized protein FDP41_003503 [Naegleria fowleri]KAF0977511.1 hypothetical protein FDP41_003503 [Naegleria fowleri]